MRKKKLRREDKRSLCVRFSHSTSFFKVARTKKGERHDPKGKVAQVGVKPHHNVEKKLSQFDSF